MRTVDGYTSLAASAQDDDWPKLATKVRAPAAEEAIAAATSSFPDFFMSIDKPIAASIARRRLLVERAGPTVRPVVCTATDGKSSDSM